MSETRIERRAVRDRQPQTTEAPLDDPREISTSEAPPVGWSSGLRVRRHLHGLACG
jgi:hypothetical protein